MRTKITILLTALIFMACFSVNTLAQDHTRNWDNGNVVAVTEVHIKDGMFNAYINDLNNVWRKYIEEQMKDGSVVGYNMLANVAAREGEPDLFLTVTYANWAAYDLGEEYYNKIRDKVLGSADVARDANIKRSELRTLGSNYNLQEVKFRK